MRRTVLAVLVALVVASCGIQADGGPRDLPSAQADVFGRPVQTGDEAAGSNRIYLLAPADADEALRLRSVLRDVPTEPGAVLDSLFAGPNTEERDTGFNTVLPQEVELLGTRQIGQVLTVDVTDAFGELTPDALRFAVAQIVTTASDLDGVGAVQLRVEGEQRQWPIGNQELVDRALTPYDYPGFVETTQPAFPSLPSDIR